MNYVKKTSSTANKESNSIDSENIANPHIGKTYSVTRMPGPDMSDQDALVFINIIQRYKHRMIYRLNCKLHKNQLNRLKSVGNLTGMSALILGIISAVPENKSFGYPAIGMGALWITIQIGISFVEEQGFDCIKRKIKKKTDKIELNKINECKIARQISQDKSR